jgi:hypothetical protein
VGGVARLRQIAPRVPALRQLAPRVPVLRPLAREPRARAGLNDHGARRGALMAAGAAVTVDR